MNTPHLIETLETRRLLSALPIFDHVVLVIEENHAYNQVIGSSQAPYINQLASGGALFTNSFAIEHPSQPNYLDLFSGSNQGSTDDSFIGRSFNAANLGSELIAAGKTFIGYSEDLPSVGSQVETSGGYAKKHNPWSDFANVPNGDSQTFTAFPSTFTNLPTVSVVVPNLTDDMHDGTVKQGDTWLQSNIGAYALWARTHNSLLMVTWDEDDGSANNHVPTIFYGANVLSGKYGESVDHFGVLQTMESLYGLPSAGQGATPITDIWTSSATVGNSPSTAVYLSDLPRLSSTIGWGTIHNDASVEGNPLTIHGVVYAKGVGTHANSQIDYALNGKYATFQSDIGLDDEVLPDHGTVIFSVWGDNTLLYTSAKLTNSSATVHLNLNVSGYQALAILAKKGLTNNYWDHADWANAMLIPANIVAPIATSMTIAPTSANVSTGSTKQFSASVFDQLGNSMSVPITWSTTNGTISNGLYLAPANAGSAVVTASYNGLSASANVTVTAVSTVTGISLPPATPPNLSWAGPITITQGGTYSGNWQSTNPNVPAVTIATSQPVVIVNSDIQSRGGLIIASVNSANLTIKHVSGWALNPNVSGQSPGRFIDLENFANLDCENNTLVGTAGIELGFWNGSQTGMSAATVKVIGNSALNIDGRWSNGAGGYQTSANANDLVQFVQFNHCIAMPGVEVAWNQVVNQPGLSRVEDNISIFQTSGTSASPILLHDNLVIGGYPANPDTDSSYSGGGIMVSDGWTSSASTDTGFVNCFSNTVISTTNYGIAISSGHDDIVTGNYIVSAGILPDGAMPASQNVGLYSWNTGDVNFARITVTNNYVGWNVAGGRNDYWMPNVSTAYGNASIAGTITTATENYYESIWLNRTSSAGIAVGA